MALKRFKNTQDMNEKSQSADPAARRRISIKLIVTVLLTLGVAYSLILLSWKILEGWGAYSATKTVLDMKDPDMTVTITAYQWKWGYEYPSEGFKYYSQLSTPRDQIDGKTGAPKGTNDLLEVDNEMVVPVGKRVRLLITSADVIHGWHVPTLGVNQNAVPGFIKDAWISVTAPGVYRGQCSQICGKDHAYMPIVVRALSEPDYKAWVKDMQAKHGKNLK